MAITLITTAGQQAIADAIANNTTLKIDRIAVGDGGGGAYTPTVSQTALKSEKWTGSLNRASVNPDNENQIIFEGMIASGVGGFFIREVGLFDENNILIALSDFPESYKAAADQYELYVRMIIEVSNTEAINVIVNKDMVYVTKDYVDNGLNSKINTKVLPVTNLNLLYGENYQGVYGIKAGQTITHAPVTTITSAILEIIYNPEDGRTRQVYTPLGSPYPYTRYIESDGNAMMGWYGGIAPPVVTSTIRYIGGQNASTDGTYYLDSDDTVGALQSGSALCFKPNFDNANPSIVFDSNDVKIPIKNASGSTPTLYAGGIYTIRYDGTANFILQGDAIEKELNEHQADLAYQKAGGTAAAITLTTATLVDGYSKTFIASANNNGADTKINGKSLYKPNTTTAPTLIAGKAYTVWYNQSSDCFFIKASAEGNATTSQVLAGATFSNDIDTGLTGEIPSKSAQTYTPTITNQTIASGQYLSGAQTIKGDANLKPENIKSGINIFGVTGNSGDLPFSSINNNALILKGLNFTSDKTYYYRVIDDAITKYSYWNNAILSKTKSSTVGVDGTYYYQFNNNQDLKVFSLDTDSLIYTIQNPNTNINGGWIGAYIRIYRSGQTLFLHSPYYNVAYFITLQGNLLRTINYGLDEGSKRTIGSANAYWVSSTKLLIFNSSGGSMSFIDAYIVDFSNLTSQRIGFLPGITLDYNFNFEIPVMLAFKAAM